MINLVAVRLAQQQRTFTETEKGGAFIAARLLEDIQRATSSPVKPVATRRQLYAYDPEHGVWCELDKDTLYSLVQNYDGVELQGKNARPLRIGTALCEDVYNCLRTNPEALKPTFFEEAPRGVPFLNGFAVVTKEGIELRPHSPDHRALSCLPIEYTPEADTPELLAVIKRVFDGDADAEDKHRLVQEFVGACMAGIPTDYAACLVMLGDGANGKSVIAETVAEQLFPPDAVTYTTPQSWMGRFATAHLRSSRLNVASELPDVEIQASDAFKAIIDGGQVFVEEKGKQGYMMRPRAGHMFLANAFPGTVDHSKGFWRRFLFVEFNQDFTKRAGYETKEAVKARLAKEAPGIALWGLHGAVRLLRQGGYTIPDSHRRLVGDLRLDADQVAAFVDECCEPDGETSLNELFGSFRGWCERTSRKLTSNRTFSRRLRALGHKDRHTRFGAAFPLTVLPVNEWSPGKSERQLRLVRDGVTERDGTKNASVTEKSEPIQAVMQSVTL